MQIDFPIGRYQITLGPFHVKENLPEFSALELSAACTHPWALARPLIKLMSSPTIL